MNKLQINIAILILFLSSGLNAQIAPNKYWVTFNDKDNVGFTVDNPIAFLSQRSIDRRITQGIAIDEKDLPVVQSYVDQVDAMTGVDILYPSKWFNAVAIFTEDTLIIEDILNLPFVGDVRSLRGRKGGDFDMNTQADKEEIAYQKVDAEYGLSFNQINMLNGIPLHNAGFEGQGMLIGVIDAGFRSADQLMSFQDLYAQGRVVATKDFVQGDISVTEDWVNTHGTLVLSTMAGILPDSTYGSATQASFLLLRSEDALSELRIEEHNWIAAAEYADSLGADILTTSLGYTTFDEASMDYTYADLDGDTGVLTIAADLAASRGMLVINSAGNSGNNDWHYIGIAADGDSVLAIGAVDYQGIHASFSSFGPSSDGRVKPNVMAQGRNTVLCDLDDTPREASGTSFSGPLLAGMSACLWQMHPQASNMQVFHAIEESASLYETPNDSMGFGIPDFWQAHLILEQWVGIAELEKDASFSLFPNPATSRLTIDFTMPTDEDVTFEIYDSKGILVFNQRKYFSRGECTSILSVSDLANGSYVFRLVSDAILSEKQFIIAK